MSGGLFSATQPFEASSAHCFNLFTPAQSLSQALHQDEGLFIKHSYLPGTLDSIRDESLGPFAKSALVALWILEAEPEKHD